MIRPSINVVAETDDLVLRNPEMQTVVSPITGERINRFFACGGITCGSGNAEQDAAVTGCLTESMCGAGSPEDQRLEISRDMPLQSYKKRLRFFRSFLVGTRADDVRTRKLLCSSV